MLKVIKTQEIKIETHKSKEEEYLDKIYDLEKKLKESNHKIELLNLEHKREVSCLKSELDKKNEEISEKLENFIMHKLDLDAYNITSDDFRDAKNDKEGSGEDPANKSPSSAKKGTFKRNPLVPKLDLQKIFDWRDKVNNEGVVMIRISESRIVGEDNFDNTEIENFNESEIHDEEVKDHIKVYFPTGSSARTTSDRAHSLLERKQMIIDALNMAYSEDGDNPV